MAVDLKSIETVGDFKRVVEEIQGQDGHVAPAAYGIGQATFQDGKLLDVWFPVVNVDEHKGVAALAAEICGHQSGTATYQMKLELTHLLRQCLRPYDNDGQLHPNRDVVDMLMYVDHSNLSGERKHVAVVAFINNLDDPPVDAIDVYLRLHLLSHRKVRPHGVNLDGTFGLLNNIAWTEEGPFLAEGFDELRLKLGLQVHVRSIDKFPRMTDYVTPSGIRVADADRVRLGAYLAEGTTVMHEGFVNFNAGTLGPCMVEGRLSAGVTVGANSDIGGGASTMGTLSGGNDTVISIGEDCLLEANSGLGIPIGDRVRIEAGFYLKGTTPVTIGRTAWRDNPQVQQVLDERSAQGAGSVTVTAEKLSGISDAIFRRNARTGEVEVIPRGERIWGKLNPVLHAN